MSSRLAPSCPPRVDGVVDVETRSPAIRTTAGVSHARLAPLLRGDESQFALPEGIRA